MASVFVRVLFHYRHRLFIHDPDFSVINLGVSQRAVKSKVTRYHA